MLLGAPFSVPLICIRAGRSCLPKKVFDRSHSFRNAHMNEVSGYSYSIVKKLSHAMPIVSAATVNRRVATSLRLTTLVGGRANTSRSEYGCSLHAQRGDSVCKNSLRIQRHQLEQRLLAGLQARVLQEEFIEYVIAGLQEELRQQHDGFESWLKNLRDEKQRIEVELKHLVEMIATGSGSPSIMAAITQREARLREITNQAVEPGPGSLKEELDELRNFAVSRLTHLREVLANPKAVYQARALLAEQIGRFTLEQVWENGVVSFKANGQIDFFGEEALHAWVVPGARIELATPAFSGRRSTNELPRHTTLVV